VGPWTRFFGVGLNAGLTELSSSDASDITLRLLFATPTAGSLVGYTGGALGYAHKRLHYWSPALRLDFDFGFAHACGCSRACLAAAAGGGPRWPRRGAAAASNSSADARQRLTVRLRLEDAPCLAERGGEHGARAYSALFHR
jgi:hypothetical protein